MQMTSSRRLRYCALPLMLLALAGCGLPRSGPTKGEIYKSSVERQGQSYIVAVDARVARATDVIPALGFSSSFTSAGQIGSDTIAPGDVLALTIWENVDSGLLASQGGNATTLSEVQVDGNGNIFVPYAGKIRAAGNSPEEVRRIITEKLAAQTPDPQVQVVRAAGDGTTVSLTGAIGGQGVFPIERPTRTLSGMIARAGGISIPPETAQITIIRGGRSEKIWYKDLFTNPRYDIALRGGDRILVEEDSRAFTALGATASQTRVKFESHSLSAIEALAQLGGLSPNLADPKGIFIFRDENEAVAQAVLGRPDLRGPQKMVYVLDLTKPDGVFVARDFQIRDDDTVYVTEAPFVQWSKTIGAITGSLSTAGSISALADKAN